MIDKMRELTDRQADAGFCKSVGKKKGSAA